MSPPNQRKKSARASAPTAWIPSRPDPRGAPPAVLADVLVGTEEIFAQRSGSAIRRAEWTRIVGARIAGRTRVGKLERGVLTIKVASSAWSNELSFLKGQLLTKLRNSGYEVTDLRFRVDQIAPDASPRKSHPLAKSQAPGSTQPPLPPELLKRLESVDDPNLRAVIAEAARASLSGARKP